MLQGFHAVRADGLGGIVTLCLERKVGSGPETTVDYGLFSLDFETGEEYAPLAHPEVALASGELLVSISRNTTDLSRLMKNPQVGRPEFVQLPR